MSYIIDRHSPSTIQQRSESSLIINFYRNLVFKNTRCPVKSDVYSNSPPLVCQLRLSGPLGKVTRIIPAIFAIGLWHRVSQHIHKLYSDVKRNGCHNQKNSKHFQSSWSHWTLQVRSTKLNTRECASGYKDRRHWLNVQTNISNWKSRSRALFQVLVKFSF